MQSQQPELNPLSGLNYCKFDKLLWLIGAPMSEALRMLPNAPQLGASSLLPGKTLALVYFMDLYDLLGRICMCINRDIKY